MKTAEAHSLRVGFHVERVIVTREGTRWMIDLLGLVGPRAGPEPPRLEEMRSVRIVIQPNSPDADSFGVDISEGAASARPGG